MTSKQDDLRTVAQFTKAIAVATNSPSAVTDAGYKVEVTVGELAHDAQANLQRAYAETANRCIETKAIMVKACSHMLAEVEKLDEAASKAVAKVNAAAGRATQSLQKTKDILGPGLEERLQQLERLVKALETLDKLNSTGAVERLTTALKGR